MTEEYPNSYDAVVANMKFPVNPVQTPKTLQESTQQYLNEMWNSELEKPQQMQTEQQSPYITPRQGYVTEAKKTPVSIVSSLFSDPPKPKYDEERQQRIQQIGKVNALGEGLKVLGDIFSLNRGANVIARQPNQDTRQAYAAWQGYEDQYANRMDEYNRQLFQQKLQNVYRQQEMDWRHYQQEKEDDYRKQQQRNWQQGFDRSNEQWNEKQKTEAKELEIREKQAAASIKASEANIEEGKSRTAQGWKSIGIAQQKADTDEEYKKARAQGKVTEDKNMIILSGASIGDAIKIDKRFRDKVLSLIVSDTKLTTDDLDLLSPRMGAPVTTAQKDYLIAKYWQQSPAVLGWLRTTEAQGTYQEEPLTEEEIHKLKGRSVNPDAGTGTATKKPQVKTSDPFDF